MPDKMLTAEDIAKVYGVSSRRIRAKVKYLKEKGVTVGKQIAGVNLWIFSEDDIPLLAPNPRGRPRKQSTP